MKMKFSIFLLVLACNYKLIDCHPGIVDSKFDLKKFRENRDKSSETISSKLTSSHSKSNSILGQQEQQKNEKFVPIPSPFQPFQLTRDDVVTPTNQIQPEAAFGPSTAQSMDSLTNGGVIFAIQRGHESQSSQLFTSAAELSGQPVLVQYVTPEGEQRVSYVQFLRPIVMVPAQPYQQPQPVTLPTRQPTSISTPATPSPSYSYFTHEHNEEDTPVAAPLIANSNLFGHQQSQDQTPIQTQQVRRHPFLFHQYQPELDLNMNEFLPSASTQSFSSVLPPSQSMLHTLPQQFHHHRFHQPHTFRRFAQRA